MELRPECPGAAGGDVPPDLDGFLLRWVPHVDLGQKCAGDVVRTKRNACSQEQVCDTGHLGGRREQTSWRRGMQGVFLVSIIF